MNAHQEDGASNSVDLSTNSDPILHLRMCLVKPYTSSISELERFGTT
jgi:hypothetical protein